MAQANFASKLGMILATAGSAVGLGNIWRFPTTTGENGGAAFILVYVLFVLLLGVPGMLAEFIVGRHGSGNALHSYRTVGGKRLWGAVGALGMVCSAIILGFYSVVAGWCLFYFIQAICDNVLGDKAFIASEFSNLLSNPWQPVLVSILFVLLTHAIVVRGVQRGIEKASKLMMPMLFVLLLLLIIASCSLPGATKGLVFLFQPDFSKITVDVLYEAVGQAFFSLSLGTACLCTYASYFKKEVSLVHSAVQVAGIDTGVAIMAGLMIFPAAFAVGLRPDAGPSLIFQTLPYVFDLAFPHAVAYVVSIVFFALLILAALTSTISMHEIGTSLISEEFKTSRGVAARYVTAFCCVIATLSALSMGPVPMGFFGQTLFDNFDGLTSNILLPFGAFVTTILIGWLVPRSLIMDELTSGGRYKVYPWALQVYLFLIRFFVPLCIAVIILSKFGVI